MPVRDASSPRLEHPGISLLLERLAEESAQCRTLANALVRALPVICAHAGWQGGHAYVVDRESDPPVLVSAGEWYIAPESGVVLSERASKPLGKGQGLPGLIWESGEPVCVTDVRSTDPRFLGRPKSPVKSWFGVPILCEQSVQGVLEFISVDARQMHVDIVLSASPIGAIVGAAFHREQLYELQRRVEETHAPHGQIELLAAALEQADDMVAMFDRDARGVWRFCYVNAAFLRTTGYTEDDLIGKDVRKFEGTRTNEAELKELRQCIGAGKPYTTQMVFVRRDGSEMWIDLNARPIRGRGGAVDHMVVVCRDVTEARLAAERLTYEAAHDALTGLFNRRYFEQALANALRGTPDQPRRHALLFVDLDGFKNVNDLHGHDYGDRMLSALAQRLHEHMREGDVFARVGGDEFAVLLHDCGPDAAMHVAQHLLSVLQATAIDCNGSPCRVGASIGIAVGEAGMLTPSDAMRQADTACYAAKRSGGNKAEMANSAQRAEHHRNSD